MPLFRRLDQLVPVFRWHPDALPLLDRAPVGASDLAERAKAPEREDDIAAVHPPMLANHFSSWQEPIVAKPIRKPQRLVFARLSDMIPNRDPYRMDVGERLRVTAADLGFPTAKEFAAHLGLERGAVDAWFNGRSLPPVPIMVSFCDRWALTLDWIYKADPSGLPLSLNIRLVAATQGQRVPSAVRRAGVADAPPVGVWQGQEPAHAPRRKPVRRKPKANVSRSST